MNSQLQVSSQAVNALSPKSFKDANLLSLKSLGDSHLLSLTKALVQRERELTTQVLRHLQEIERRKLYCDLKYGSLFDYAVRELKYSEAAAARRIQAMRLMKEIPEVESKIESGALNLSNISQAQSFFREQKKAEPTRPLGKEAKQEIPKKLEQKSAREGQRILLEIGGNEILPKERERVIGPAHTELRFLVDQELKAKLEEVRSLLGMRGAQMNFAELVSEMAKLSAEKLSEKKFGKRRMQAQTALEKDDSNIGVKDQAKKLDREAACSDVGVKIAGSEELHSRRRSSEDLAKLSWSQGLNTRYISQEAKHRVWQKAQGQCAYCGSKMNLQFDHIQPFALGGASRLENLQLLCRACNLRRGVRGLGTQAMRRA